MYIRKLNDTTFQAAGDQDLAVKFLVMAAEVAISCGDPTEAQLACAAVTQAVDDSGASGHLTLLDQVCAVLRRFSFVASMLCPCRWMLNGT